MTKEIPTSLLERIKDKYGNFFGLPIYIKRCRRLFFKRHCGLRMRKAKILYDFGTKDYGETNWEIFYCSHPQCTFYISRNTSIGGAPDF